MSGIDFNPTDPDTKRNIMLRFREMLQLLAASADEQIDAFPKEFAAVSDELASDFDHWYQVVVAHYPGEFGDTQLEHLRAIDQTLKRMENEALWTLESVREAEEWRHVREYARQVIFGFGWRLETPPKWPDRREAV